MTAAAWGPIYAIADRAALGPTPLAAAVAEIAGAGIRVIQVRGKGLAGAELFRQLELCCRTAQEHGADLWVNDRADLASLLPVHGVHLGQLDLPPWAARRALGRRKRIGLSTHDEAQVLAADADPDVNLIAVGPIFPTASKANAGPILGLEFLSRLRGLTKKPLVAIGGIDASNVAAVLSTGADSAAVLSTICRGGLADIGANCRRLLQAARGA